MGKRREPRKAIEVPVRIFGTDSAGKVFSARAATIDVSQNGAKLGGVQAKLKLDEIIGLTCGKNKVHFKVKWIGVPGTPSEGQLGLLNLTPQKPLWDFPLPRGDLDSFQFSGNDRRKSPRVKCSIPVEIRPPEATVIRGKASDLSHGGCFVEMPMPLPIDTKFDIALWLGDIKLKLQGQVASAAPGFGIGVRFLNLSPGNQEALRRYVDTIIQTLA